MRTIEERLADAIRFEAERLPDEPAAHTLTPVSDQRSSFPRPGLAAPIAVVAVMVVAAPVIWLSAGRNSGGQTPPPAPTTQATTAETSQSAATTSVPPPAFDGRLEAIIDQLPDGFDLENATPIFVADAPLEETALDYLESRHLPDGVGIRQVEEHGDFTLARWAWGRLLDETETEQGESGWLIMRPAGTGHEVLAATTDGIDVSDVIQTSSGQMIGGVISNTDEHIGVDVLNLDGTPVASAPNPEGMPDADFLWGTAASGISPLGFDVQVSGPVLLRVNRVGGALLSISEVALGQDSEEDIDGTQDGAPTDTLREPTSEDWIELPGGLSVAVIEDRDGDGVNVRIWTMSAVQEPTPAPSSDIAFLPVPVDATQIAILIPVWQFYAEQGIEITPYEKSDEAAIHWFEGSDAVDIVTVDWSGDERFGVALVEARDANILDVQLVND